MKNRTLVIATLLVGLFIAPTFAAEDMKAYSMFVGGADTWSSDKSADKRIAKIKQEKDAWALFQTSTKFWKSSKSVIPAQEMGDRFVNLFGTNVVVRATN